MKPVITYMDFDAAAECLTYDVGRLLRWTAPPCTQLLEVERTATHCRWVFKWDVPRWVMNQRVVIFNDLGALTALLILPGILCLGDSVELDYRICYREDGGDYTILNPVNGLHVPFPLTIGV